MSVKPTVFIIKRKAAHNAHHGGAWKVAYADFVTAMMALFIVLWLLNTSKEIQKAISGYFKDPSGYAKTNGSNMRGSGDSFFLSKDNMADLKEELQNAVRQVPNFEKVKNHIEMTITAEGLRIELLESANGTFFDKGNSEPNVDGRDILILLAQELGNIPNKIAIEGHTDSKPYTPRSNYGNWELSVDRANAARRLMQQHGMRDTQVTQVRGFADQRLRKPDDPFDPSNRRVSVIVEYQSSKADAGQADSDKNKDQTKPSETPPKKELPNKH